MSRRSDDDDEYSGGGWRFLGVCCGVLLCLVAITGLIVGSVALAKINNYISDNPTPPTEDPGVGPAAVAVANFNVRQKAANNAVPQLQQQSPQRAQQLAALLKNGKRSVADAKEEEEIPPLIDSKKVKAV